MKVKVTLNGKTADIDIPDEKLEELGLKEKKKLTGYERVAFGNPYYYTEWNGCKNECQEYERLTDKISYDSGNYVSDESLAEANARAETLMRKLRRFAAENGGIPSAEDWKDLAKEKWHLYYDYRFETFGFIDRTSVRTPGTIFFNSKEACCKAIEEFKDELTWYFTEYQAMLY